MPKAWDVYVRVLEVGRGLLAKPMLEEKALVKQLKDLKGEAFAAFARQAGVGSEKHLRYTVLAVADYPEAEREALRRGASFAQVERLRRLVKRGKLSRERLEQAVADGTWASLLNRRRARPDWAKKPVWVFPANKRARKEEGLNPVIAGLLVEQYSEPGELMVDPMAGSGTVAKAAQALGRAVWASDIAGDGELVKKLDVKDLTGALGQERADLLVLHPPTYRWFLEHMYEPNQRYQDHPYDEYANWLSELLEHALPTLRPGGKAVLVARPQHRPGAGWKPHNAKGRWPFVAPLENLLAEHDLEPVYYHLAVSNDGEEDWSIFVARKSEEDSEDHVRRAGP